MAMVGGEEGRRNEKKEERREGLETVGGVRGRQEGWKEQILGLGQLGLGKERKKRVQGETKDQKGFLVAWSSLVQIRKGVIRKR